MRRKGREGRGWLSTIHILVFWNSDVLPVVHLAIAVIADGIVGARRLAGKSAGSGSYGDRVGAGSMRPGGV